MRIRWKGQHFNSCVLINCSENRAESLCKSARQFFLYVDMTPHYKRQFLRNFLHELYKPFVSPLFIMPVWTFEHCPVSDSFCALSCFFAAVFLPLWLSAFFCPLLERLSPGLHRFLLSTFRCGLLGCKRSLGGNFLCIALSRLFFWMRRALAKLRIDVPTIGNDGGCSIQNRYLKMKLDLKLYALHKCLNS